MTPQSAALWQCAADVLRVTDFGPPSRFAAEHRVLKMGTTERPGPWSNEHFPHLASIMDCAGEALESGRNFCGIKAGQGGGSEAMINFLSYLKAKYTGPILYVISKEDVAAEFGRERFDYILDTCAPVARKALRGKAAGESLHHKRFTDGKLDIRGGRSILNLQSQPYRFVFIDEVDSLLDEIKNQGDPLKIAQVRMDAFEGRTMLLAFGHPTTKERGGGRLYYELSDQRRGFVACVHCGKELWLSWEHVSAVPTLGLNQSQADHRAACYLYLCPHCGQEISDADRWKMIRDVKQKSTLPAEIAQEKTWLGTHFSQLYYPHKTLRELAAQYVAALDNESAMIVFRNKILGDVYEPKIAEITADQWRRLICLSGAGVPPAKDGSAGVPPALQGGRDARPPEFWQRGQVPWGVRFLTAGQDSRSTELHWAVWGWGLRRGADEHVALCARLIDFGVVDRQYSLELDPRELVVFDNLLYNRRFPATYDSKLFFEVLQCGHDIGWNHIAVCEYCRRNPYRALPVRGAADTLSSRSTQPAVRPGSAPVYVLRGQTVKDERLRPLYLNTYILKVQFYGMLDKMLPIIDAPGAPARNLPCIQLPADMTALRDGERFMTEASNEYLKPYRKGDFVWDRKGPNHFADCTVYAYACALNLNPFDSGLPFEEAEAERNKPEPPADPAADEKKEEERTGRGWRIGR